MHEVELIKRVRTKLRSAVDIADADVRPPSEDTVRRVIVATLDILGIRIRPDGQIAITTPEERMLRQATLINGGLANGYTPMGFSPDEHALAAQLRREAAPAATSHTEHAFVYGFCLCGEPEPPG